LLLFFFAFFLVAMDLFSLFHSSWNVCNDLQLQLIECIESTQSEVKKKMIERSDRTDAPRSLRGHRDMRDEDFFRGGMSESCGGAGALREQMEKLKAPDECMGWQMKLRVEGQRERRIAQSRHL
jgi:hypothetical protein